VLATISRYSYRETALIKNENWRLVSKTYSGRWSSDLFGNLTIHLDSVLRETDIDAMTGIPALPEPLNRSYQFQWEQDRTGLLVLIPAPDSLKITHQDPN